MSKCGGRAATAAISAGLLRASQGRYLEAFLIAGVTAIGAAIASLLIQRGTKTALVAH